MPRVTFTTYCERRTKLQQVWRISSGDFSGLSPNEQWDLHEYYRFADSLTTDQVREHWTKQHTKSSSMAQRAGRAYAALGLALASKVAPVEHPSQLVNGRKRKLGKVKVESVVLPQSDTKKLAKVLLSFFRPDASDR